MNPHFFIPFFIGIGAALLAGWAIWRVFNSKTKALLFSIKQKEKVNQSLDIRYNDSLNEFKSLRKEHQKLLLKEKIMADTIADWEEKYNTLNNNFNELRQNWRQLHTEFEGYRWEAKSQTAQLKKEIEAGNTKLKIVQQNYSDLNTLHASLQREFNDFRSKSSREIAEAEATKAQLENEVNEIQKDCEVRIADTFVQFAELNSQYKRLKKDGERNKIRIKTLLEEKARLEKALNEERKKTQSFL